MVVPLCCTGSFDEIKLRLIPGLSVCGKSLVAIQFALSSDFFHS